ncbi:MAG: hypothetical protein KDG89_01505 [Geminicoccaceae bacterium]|nr:hypothetical protein [Geminicoccaceae bacterium]
MRPLWIVLALLAVLGTGYAAYSLTAAPPPAEQGSSDALAGAVAEIAERDAAATATLRERYPALADPDLGRQVGADATRADVEARRRALEAAAEALRRSRPELRAMQDGLAADLPLILERNGVAPETRQALIQGFTGREASGTNLTLALADATEAAYGAEAALLALLDEAWGTWRRGENGLVFEDPADQARFDDLRARTLEAQGARRDRLDEWQSHRRRLMQAFGG